MSIVNLWTTVAPFVYAVCIGVVYAFYLSQVSPEYNHLIGVALSIAGFTGWIVAKQQLGQAFSVNPQAAQLVVHGLYSVFRHPIYYFELLTFIGAAIFFWDVYVAGAVFFLFVVQLYRMHKENAVLREHFGDEYMRHVAHVWF